MSALDKLLARSAEECTRLDADNWRLALSNGHSLTVSARRDEDFLLLDAETGTKATANTLVALAQRSREFALPVKPALCRASPHIRLRAEIPLPEESAEAGDRIHTALEGMRAASHQLHNALPDEAAPATVAPEHFPAAGLTELLSETGWQHHERPGGAVLADLETGSQFLQAEIERYGTGVRFAMTLYRGDAASPVAQQALCLYLLEANAAVRYARAFFRSGENEILAGFEVCFTSGSLESLPSPAEVGHALGALSVAGRQCVREIGVLMKDGSLAGAYRSTVPLLD